MGLEIDVIVLKELLEEETVVVVVTCQDHLLKVLGPVINIFNDWCVPILMRLFWRFRELLQRWVTCLDSKRHYHVITLLGSTYERTEMLMGS